MSSSGLSSLGSVQKRLEQDRARMRRAAGPSSAAADASAAPPDRPPSSAGHVSASETRVPRAQRDAAPVADALDVLCASATPRGTTPPAASPMNAGVTSPRSIPVNLDQTEAPVPYPVQPPTPSLEMHRPSPKIEGSHAHRSLMPQEPDNVEAPRIPKRTPVTPAPSHSATFPNPSPAKAEAAPAGLRSQQPEKIFQADRSNFTRILAFKREGKRWEPPEQPEERAALREEALFFGCMALVERLDELEGNNFGMAS